MAATGGAVIVYFKRMAPWYLPRARELTDALPLRARFSAADGVVYEVASRTN
jgi:hypothetical protein